MYTTADKAANPNNNMGTDRRLELRHTDISHVVDRNLIIQTHDEEVESLQTALSQSTALVVEGFQAVSRWLKACLAVVQPKSIQNNGPRLFSDPWENTLVLG